MRIGSPNGAPNGSDTGLLTTIGPLGFNTTVLVGFDVSEFGGTLAALRSLGSPSSVLARIDLATGAATTIGTVAGAPLRDLAFAQGPR